MAGPRRVLLTLCWVLVVSLLLAACAQGPVESEAVPPAAAAAQPESNGGAETASAAPSAGGALQCEDPYADVYAALDGLEGEQRRSRLAELAQTEGTVSVYSTNASMDAVIPAFEEEFGVTVDLYRAPSNTVAQRVHEEAAAGRLGADIVDNKGDLMLIAYRDGILADYEGPILDELPDIAKGIGFTANQYVVYIAGWNPDALPEGGAPTSYEDFADPRWEGRITLDPRQDSMYYALHEHFTQNEGMSSEDFQELFRQIGANAALVEGAPERTNSVVSGEHAASIGIFLHAVDKAAREGAPITWEPAVEPFYVEPGGAGLAICSSNPAAALLFYEWVATDGQEVMAAQERVTTPEFVEGGRLDGVHLLEIDFGAYVDSRERWESEFRGLIGYE